MECLDNSIFEQSLCHSMLPYGKKYSLSKHSVGVLLFFSFCKFSSQHAHGALLNGVFPILYFIYLIRLTVYRIKQGDPEHGIVPNTVH